MSRVLSSFIAVTFDLEAFKEQLEQTYADYRKVFFFKDDFLVEDAKAVIAEAFIAESSQKIIALGAKSFNLIAQNSLLKVLEEPPRNIVFILCVPSKTALLPTIRSRLPIKTFQVQKQSVQSGLNFKNLNIQDIYGFLQTNKNLNKQEVMPMIEAISKEALLSGVALKEEDLTLFATLLQLAHLNSRPQVLLSTQLLTILKRARL